MRVIVIFLCEQNGLNGHRLFFLVNHFVCARHETDDWFQDQCVLEARLV